MRSPRTVTTAAAFCLATLLGACTSTYHGPPPIENFATRIADNRLKFFTYTWHFRAPGRQESVDPGTPDWAGPGDVDGLIRRDLTQLSADIFRQFRERMHERLEESGFCREDYIELSRSYWPGEFRIRGECRDLATKTDRRRFPDASTDRGAVPGLGQQN